ncbi:spindle and kinetochore-associated protein 3 isoform X2 [Brienomyrus brachyistius]|uniref:spindle and kinetochore-associated protein 3 isoform X2 n=1 Tax=Brienomyrus brachyistius TaxID=42636 RepID=UPI0020B3C8A2|nr:spindle and kinetochore-associated protein 3 isoform X2 [Brienomyrus brachyistius]
MLFEVLEVFETNSGRGETMDTEKEEPWARQWRQIRKRRRVTLVEATGWKMESSARVFGKLRNLALLLETETAELHRAHKNPDHEGTKGTVKVLHELHTEVRDLKVQVRDQLACCRVEDRELRSFMQACMVLKQRTTEDLRLLRRHYEKYGYKAPSEVKGHKDDQKAEKTQASKDGEEEEQEVEEEKEQHLAVDGETVAAPVCMTPAKPAPRTADPMRTPRLSDFGLSGFHLLAPLGEPAPPPVAYAPPMAEPPALSSLPRVPKTPKCTLKMDEEALTPRLEDFGISEHTMCLNNDFTMDLLRKKPSRLHSDAVASVDLDPVPATVLAPVPAPVPAPELDSYLLSPMPASVTSDLEANDVASPQPPVLCTPGLKITKKKSHAASLLDGDSTQLPDLHLTPEPPAFETPYVKKLVRDEEARPSKVFSSRSLVHQPDIPSIPFRAAPKDENTPEMPTLESFLSSCPRRVDGAAPLVTNKASGSSFGLKEPLLPDLGANRELQDYERTLLSPPGQSRLVPHPKTPDMPDISSFTQDIFKLISQDNITSTSAIPATPKTTALQSATLSGKENRVQALNLVLEEEFCGLPGYLRQMPLSSLNQAIRKINTALEGRQWEVTCPWALQQGP